MDINKLSFKISGSTNDALKAVQELSKSLGKLSDSYKKLSRQVQSSSSTLSTNMTRSTSSLKIH